MEIPSIKILSQSLQLLNEIDLYTSLQFTRSWQGVGSFELHILGNCPTTTIGNLIMLSNDGHRAGIIRSVTKTVDVNGVSTTITGQTLDGIVSQRITVPWSDVREKGYFTVPKTSSTDKTVPAETILKTFAAWHLRPVSTNKPRAIGEQDFVVASNKKRGIDTNWISRYERLDEVMQSISEYCDCGWEIYIDLKNSRLIFDYLEGVDRSVNQNENSRVILSRDFESIDSLTYTQDDSEFRNIAYCGGAGEDENRTVLAVTNENTTPQGLNRFEVFEDCGTLEIAETDTSVSLKYEGLHKLEEYKKIETLTAEIAQGGSFVYLKDWNLGDLVTVRDRELNIMQDLRITEVSENYEPDNINISVTLGILPLRLGKVIKKIKPTVR